MYYLNRRQFLRSAYLVSLAGLLPSTNSWAYSTGNSDSSNNKLIVILLRGAVDGLSVVPPYADSLYYSLRPTIAVAKPGNNNGVLDLDGHFGMNPALEPLLPLWRSKGLAFVHASGSPDPTRSHFDAQDYMESGMPGVKMASSGWLNRLVQQMPSNDSPVQALNLGAVLPRIFAGTGKVGSAPRNLAENKLVLDRPVIADYFSQLYRDEGTDLGQAFAEGMSAHKTIENAMSEVENAPPTPTNGPNQYMSALVSEEKPLVAVPLHLEIMVILAIN